MNWGRRCKLFRLCASLGLLLIMPPLWAQTSVTVEVENLAPPNGNFLTPVWVGFHDGSFDLYDIGDPATPGLESLAEDGATATLSGEFLASTAGTVDGTIVSGGTIPPLAPGARARMTFTLDGSAADSRYFSYASMVIPSNDAFVANGNPMAHPVFDSQGNFLGARFLVMGGDVRDAGTEVNDEAPANTAFFGQAAPNTGTAENGTVQNHPGFKPAGSGGILDDPQFAAADFTAPGYPVARITVTRTRVKVTVENLAPANGNFLTPVWVGFHDGSFDLYDIGAAASPGLESLAEDGATGTLSAEFQAAGAGTVEGTIASGGAIPPLAPGQTAMMTFDLDPGAAESRYFSYASMVIPSNDAFVANGNPMAHHVFDENGNFSGASFIVLGEDVRDAGTEVNDETPANTAFFGQAAPNTGVAEGGTVQNHPGFLPVGSGGILADPNFAAADFTADGYRIARITVSLEGQDLHFPQIGDGDGLFTQLTLFSLNETDTHATLILKDDDGDPLEIDLNGQDVEEGELDVVVPARGVLVLRTDGVGDLVAGSARLRSTQPLRGVLLFGGAIGLEGILASPALPTGFIAPVETNQAAGISTALAVMNLEHEEVTVVLRLCDANGVEIARAQLDPALAPMGHRARFISELNWDRQVDFSDFVGLLKATASGRTAAVLLQTRPNQLAALPVVVQ